MWPHQNHVHSVRVQIITTMHVVLTQDDDDDGLGVRAVWSHQRQFAALPYMRTCLMGSLSPIVCVF